jgi:hypothetical protein
MEGMGWFQVQAEATLTPGENRNLGVLRAGVMPPPLATPENAHLLEELRKNLPPKQQAQSTSEKKSPEGGQSTGPESVRERMREEEDKRLRAAEQAELALRVLQRDQRIAQEHARSDEMAAAKQKVEQAEYERRATERENGAAGAHGQTDEPAIQKHILTIRTNPSTQAKKNAGEALAQIGLPSLAPLMDYLHRVAQAKPGDGIWIHPGYIRDALSSVCKRVGPEAEKVILARLLAVGNETERECLFRALAEGAGYPKTLARLLGVIRNTATLDANTKWAVREVVNLYVYGGGDGGIREEAAISELLDVFAEYPELQSKHAEIQNHVTVLKTVGVPAENTTFRPQLHRPLQIAVDEQTEFFVAMPRPNGPWGYKWGFEKGMEAAPTWRQHGLCYLGRTLGTDTTYFRFIGMHAVKTELDAYVQGGVPDNDPAEYPMTVTVRALSPKERERKLQELSTSLDDRKRKYAEEMRRAEQGRTGDNEKTPSKPQDAAGVGQPPTNTTPVTVEGINPAPAIIRPIAERYSKTHGGVAVQVKQTLGGPAVCAAAMAEGTADLVVLYGAPDVLSHYYVKGREIGRLQDVFKKDEVQTHVLGWRAMAVVVSPKSELNEISDATVRQIVLSLSNAKNPDPLKSRGIRYMAEGYGYSMEMRRLILGEDKFLVGGNMAASTTRKEILEQVAADPKLMAFMALDEKLSSSGAKILPVRFDGGPPVAPTVNSVLSGEYRYRVCMLLAIHPKASAAARAFAQELLGTEFARKLDEHDNYWISRESK